MARKGLLLVTVAVQTLIVIFYSTSFLSGSKGMMEEFEIEKKMTMTLGMTMYMFGKCWIISLMFTNFRVGS